MKRPRNQLRILVPATTANLGAGFDTLGLALELRNEVWMRRAPRGSGMRYSAEGEGAGEVASTPGANLFDEVLRATLRKHHVASPDLEIHMVNRIPWRRGLGSSSAAAVAGAVAGLGLAGRPVDPDGVLQCALPFEGHPDNLAPAVAGGFTVATLDRRRARFVRLDPPRLLAIALIPSFGISTSAARALLPTRVPFGDAVQNVTRAALCVAAIAARRYDLLSLGTQDLLHQPYRAALVPGFEAVCRAALRAGAAAAFLSGSGPTILALVETGRVPAVRAAMTRAWRKAGKRPVRLEVLAPARRGVVVRGSLG